MSDVFKWDESRDLTKLSGWCVTISPPSGRVRTMLTLTKATQAGLSALLESNRGSVATSTFGSVLVWAERWDESLGWRDTQRVLDGVYSRGVVRAALQWLRRNRTASDAPVEVRTVPTEGVPVQGGDPKPGHALVMRCGDWAAIVMSCLTKHVGDDPLFPEAR